MRQALVAGASALVRRPPTVPCRLMSREFLCLRQQPHRTFSSRDAAAYPDSLTDPKYRDDITALGRTTASGLPADAIPVGVYHGERIQRPPPERVQHFCRRPIYVAATKQHVGKTTTSLALMSGLSKRFDKVGFIKPVGQQHLEVRSTSGETIRVDKDVVLVREHFKLDHCPYRSMSPCLIGSGYTKQFIDGGIRLDKQLDDIVAAFRDIDDRSDVVLCEGTGHAGVGSIVGASNAKIASMLGADCVLVANGGLGSTFDELELNRVLCEQHGVNIAGIIVNKVKLDKYEQTKHYMSRAFMDMWGVPLLGVIPDRPYLGCPALADLERLFKTEMVSGRCHRFRHYKISDLNLVTTSLSRFLENMREKPSRTLYICHVTRDDIILGFLGEYARRRRHGEPFEAALLVSGREGKYDVSPEVMDMITDATLSDVPVLIARHTTHTAMELITNMTPKLNIDDAGTYLQILFLSISSPILTISSLPQNLLNLQAVLRQL